MDSSVSSIDGCTYITIAQPIWGRYNYYLFYYCYLPFYCLRELTFSKVK